MQASGVSRTLGVVRRSVNISDDPCSGKREIDSFYNSYTPSIGSGD